MNTLNDTIRYDYFASRVINMSNFIIQFAILVYSSIRVQFYIMLFMNILNDIIQCGYFALRAIIMSNFIVQLCNLSLLIQQIKYIGL
jgi:hypothetical protein